MSRVDPLMMLSRPHDAEFVSQRIFRTAVLLAVRAGLDPGAYLPLRVIVHPDSLRWYEALLGHERMREHFGMLS